MSCSRTWLKPYTCLGKSLFRRRAKMGGDDGFLFTCMYNGEVDKFIEGLERKWQERNKRFKELQADLVAAVEQRQVRKEHLLNKLPTCYSSSRNGAVASKLYLHAPTRRQCWSPSVGRHQPYWTGHLQGESEDSDPAVAFSVQEQSLLLRCRQPSSWCSSASAFSTSWTAPRQLSLLCHMTALQQGLKVA